MKLGLQNIRALLRSVGEPHKNFPSVHIAGTNGKGSTSSMIAAVLTSAGYKVGLYTSPHLVRFNERIRINGAMISDADLIRCTKMLRSKIDSLNATFFEATTAIAFKYFADKKIDIGVIETGLGGRLDATNVLLPEVSVITSIGKDHTQQLGNSLCKIAFEKGGIIKRNVPCVTGVKNRSALRGLRRIGKQKKSQLIEIDKVSSSKSEGKKNHFLLCSIVTKNNSYNNLPIPLLGDCQIRNAQVVITALEQLQSKGFAIPKESFYRGFENLQRLTGIRGRFEILQAQPLVILDVGHNPDGIAATVSALKSFRYRRLLLIFGVMKDKDYGKMIRTLASLKPVVFAVQPEMERALPSEVIAKKFQEEKCAAAAYGHVSEAVRNALHFQEKNDMLLICGSHYVAGEALQFLDRKPR